MRNAIVVVSLFLAVTATAQGRFFPQLVRADAGWLKELQAFAELTAFPENAPIRVRYDIVGDATYESITAAGWTCTVAGKTAECSTASPAGSFSRTFAIVVRASNGNGAQSTLRMFFNDASNPAATATLQNYRVVIVKNVADSGPGSLRAAIEEANAAGKPAKMLFEIPQPVPSEGWFTITPASPLPAITVESMFVDGKSQTRYTGDTNTRGPEIAIDGHLAHRGLEIHSPCEAKVEGLVLGHFDANQGLWFTKGGRCVTPLFTVNDERWVADNYIGTDPTGTVAWPNLRGLRVDFNVGIVRNNLISGNTYSGMWAWITSDRPASLLVENNKFGTAADGSTPLPNGAAGMLFGPRVSADVRHNIISNHPGMGIALARGTTYVEIRANSMRDNGGIGIDWGIDGVSPRVIDDSDTTPNAPVILSSRYEAATNRTYFTVVVDSGRPTGPNGYLLGLDFYANRGPDGDGEQWLGAGDGDSLDTTFETSLPGDLRGQWINATTTRYPILFAHTPGVNAQPIDVPGMGEASTSEFSNAVLVP